MPAYTARLVDEKRGMIQLSARSVSHTAVASIRVRGAACEIPPPTVMTPFSAARVKRLVHLRNEFLACAIRCGRWNGGDPHGERAAIEIRRLWPEFTRPVTLFARRSLLSELSDTRKPACRDLFMSFLR